MQLTAANVGPIAPSTVTGLERLGIILDIEHRMPLAVTERDLLAAEHIVAAKQREHLAMIQQRFPAWTDRIEFWHIDDVEFAAPEAALAELEREVVALLERLRER